MTCILHTARISNVGRKMVNFTLCAESHRFNLGTQIFSLSHARDMLITSFPISSPKLKNYHLSLFVIHICTHNWKLGESEERKTKQKQQNFCITSFVLRYLPLSSHLQSKLENFRQPFCLQP